MTDPRGEILATLNNVPIYRFCRCALCLKWRGEPIPDLRPAGKRDA